MTKYTVRGGGSVNDPHIFVDITKYKQCTVRSYSEEITKSAYTDLSGKLYDMNLNPLGNEWHNISDKSFNNIAITLLIISVIAVSGLLLWWMI